MPKCDWCKGSDIYERYHDEEWGVPLLDEHKTFEFLILEGVQAGLSWLTVLKRREDYRLVYEQFNAEKMARWGDHRIEQLMLDSRIIRNRLKIESARRNAQAYLAMLEAGQSLQSFFWDFVEGQPIQNQFHSMSDVPAQTDLSVKISKALKKLGFNFVGPTIVYAHMQAMGLVNDHLLGCERHSACETLAKRMGEQ
ncbi:MAG: DNA-3-methyladenine glycosylase I [Gammaproteobacteria bacterium]|nr:DNA-3-methyladenine glycosylase I [Gammaproteobacteria bacterium]